MDNVHGIAQSVWDVRRLVRWAAAQGNQPVGITGVSLGGFVTAMVAGLEPDLACAILGVPAVDLIDLIDHHSTRQRDPQYLRMIDLARQVGVVVSPLSVRPQLRFERRFVYAGLADRLAHPRHQVGRLWEHWGRPEVLWYKGGHVAFARTKAVGRFVRGALESSGLTG
jgi:dienelactone hydrolase